MEAAAPVELVVAVAPRGAAVDTVEAEVEQVEPVEPGEPVVVQVEKGVAGVAAEVVAAVAVLREAAARSATLPRTTCRACTNVTI